MKITAAFAFAGLVISTFAAPVAISDETASSDITARADQAKDAKDAKQWYPDNNNDNYYPWWRRRNRNWWDNRWCQPQIKTWYGQSWKFDCRTWQWTPVTDGGNFDPAWCPEGRVC